MRKLYYSLVLLISSIGSIGSICTAAVLSAVLLETIVAVLVVLRAVHGG